MFTGGSGGGGFERRAGGSACLFTAVFLDVLQGEQVQSIVACLRRDTAER